MNRTFEELIKECEKLNEDYYNRKKKFLIINEAEYNSVIDRYKLYGLIDVATFSHVGKALKIMEVHLIKFNMNEILKSGIQYLSVPHFHFDFENFLEMDFESYNVDAVTIHYDLEFEEFLKDVGCDYQTGLCFGEPKILLDVEKIITYRRIKKRKKIIDGLI